MKITPQPSAFVLVISILYGVIATITYLRALMDDQPPLLCFVCALSILCNLYALLIGAGRAPVWYWGRATPPLTVDFTHLDALPAEHPLVQEPRARCVVCHEPFKAGDLTTLVHAPALNVHTACMHAFADTYESRSS